MSFSEKTRRPGIHRREALGHLFAAAAAAAGVTAARPARADTFPSKPIILILPFPPGGSFDPVLRALCNAAGQDLGQPIVLMHKPGGGGVTGTASLATMTESDGYSLAVMRGTRAVTLPVRMWAGIQFELNPTVAAVSAMLIAVSIVAFATVELARRR